VLSPSQLSALSASQLAALGGANSGTSGGTSGGTGSTPANQLTADQLNNLSSSQVSALTAVQLGQLKASTVSGMSTRTLSFLSASQTAALLATQANNLSIAQISSFATSQLSTTTLVGAANGLQFNFSWDASVGTAPTGFRNAVVAAAAGLAADFSNKVTVNIATGYGEVDGSPVDAGAVAETGFYSSHVAYATLLAALQADAGNSSVQTTADASLSASNPTSGGTFAVSTAEAKALGLSGASSHLDGFVGLSSALTFDFRQGAAGGKYDAIGAFQHEFTEVMGRTGSVGAWQGAGVYTALDLFRYTSTNNSNPSAGTPIRALTQQSGNVAYFSIDGGQTNLGGFNASTGSADYGDWNTTMGNDPFGFGRTGVVQAMSGNDAVVMAALGWNMTSKGATLAQTAVTYALV
jgi:hypothetical protein